MKKMNIALSLKLYSRTLSSILSKRNLNCPAPNNFRSWNFQFTNTFKTSLSSVYFINIVSPSRWYSSDNKTSGLEKNDSQKVETIVQDAPSAKISQRTRLKHAVRDYGATIIVFHVAISLASLGLSYLAISSGVDAVKLLTFIGFSESVISSKVAVGGSTFVMAYAFHKVFAPVRIGITLSVAPFIVRYLRMIKWLKPPKNKT